MSTTEDANMSIVEPDDEKAVAVSSEKAAVDSDSTDSADDNKSAHLHAKTWLAVLAVGLIYFAQLVNLVGAGAVCKSMDSIRGIVHVC